jgi:hypothetical protein
MGTADFDGGSGTDWHTSVQDEDTWLVRQKPDGTW